MKKDYTLIELLVTVSIIMILLSLLITVMEVSKKKQEAIACVANGKDLMATSFEFTADNNGSFPQAVFDAQNKFSEVGKGWYGWDERLMPYYGYTVPDGIINPRDIQLSRIRDDYSENNFAEEFRCPGSDLQENSDKVLRSYNIHRASSKLSNNIGAQNVNPWRDGTVRGLSATKHISANGRFSYGHAARLSQLHTPSESIAFAELNDQYNLFGDTEGADNFRVYKHYGYDSSKFNEQYTNEDAWPHGFGKLTYMLVDGGVKHGDLQDTVDQDYELWTSTSDREVGNGLWDCWPGKKAEIGSYKNKNYW